MATFLNSLSCVFVLFTLEIVSRYLLDLGCTLGQVMSIGILCGDNWYPAIIGRKAVSLSKRLCFWQHIFGAK